MLERATEVERNLGDHKRRVEYCGSLKNVHRPLPAGRNNSAEISANKLEGGYLRLRANYLSKAGEPNAEGKEDWRSRLKNEPLGR